MRPNETLLTILVALILGIFFGQIYDKNVSFFVTMFLVVLGLFVANVITYYCLTFRDIKAREKEYDKMLVFFENHPEAIRNSGQVMGFTRHD